MRLFAWGALYTTPKRKMKAQSHDLRTVVLFRFVFSHPIHHLRPSFSLHTITGRDIKQDLRYAQKRTWYTFRYFYSNYLVLFTMVPRKNSSSDPGSHSRLLSPLPAAYGSCVTFSSREHCCSAFFPGRPSLEPCYISKNSVRHKTMFLRQGIHTLSGNSSALWAPLRSPVKRVCIYIYI